MVDLSGLNLNGAIHTVEFDQGASTNWTFVSEVSFFGGLGVPEPATGVMMIGGLALTGAAMRRRASVAAL